ncbi:MAG TPA: hypothetical protein VIC55_09995 [Gemmatimonadaceae bacterium]|jgi:antitoxin (DNA-binding transcriptional repressor) of toxin-antitoxin stability system
MDTRISASLLARRLADILGRVRYRGETFLVERHNVPIARIGPAGAVARATLADAARAWMTVSHRDRSFADDLDRVAAADRPPRNPWAS